MLDLNSIDPSKTFYLIKDLNLDVVKNDDRLSDNERGILLNNNEVLFEYIDFYTNALGNQKFNRCFHLVESFKYKINSTDLAECKNHFLFDYDEVYLCYYYYLLTLLLI